MGQAVDSSGYRPSRIVLVADVGDGNPLPRVRRFDERGDDVAVESGQLPARRVARRRR